MPKKIFLVSNTAWSFTRFRADLIRWLVSRGFDVLLLAPADEQVSDLTALGARFVALRKMKRKGMNPLSDLELYREFSTIYRREQPDLVIQYTIKPNIYSTLAATKLGIPVVAVITGLGYTFINESLLTTIAKRLYRFALNKASQVWFLNDDDREVFINGRLVNEHKVRQIPGEGINCEHRFNPTSYPNNIREGHRLKFLFIGRLLYDKGIREYIAAAKAIKQDYPEVSFGVLGYLNVDNPAAVQGEQLASWVAEGWVHYFGSVDDVRPIIADADCVVLPSYREGMSTTLQESASMAKPIIASDIAGCREIVEVGTTGFLCQVKDSGDVEKHMRLMISLTNDERKQMGEKGRRKMIDEFSVSRVISIYESMISEILGE